MADRKSDKRLLIIMILMAASGVVLVGIAAGTKTEVPFVLGLSLVFLAGVPATIALVRYARHMIELEKRIDDLESRREQRD